MTQSQRILAAIDRAALAELDTAWFRALTAQANGEGSDAAWEQFEKMLTRALVLGNLCGRLGVVQTLRVKVEPEKRFERGSLAMYADEPIITSPFAQALNWFMGKIPMLRRTVDALLPAAKAKAFWVTGVESKEALARIQERLAKPLQAEGPVEVEKANGKPGSELPGSQSAFIREEESATGMARARLETVYRTNVMSALNEGAKDMMTSPDLKSAVALIQLNEIHDSRTRGAPGTHNPGKHWQMDGFVESPDHPIWAVITPPNGFQCRGSLSPISWLTAERMGLAKDGVLDQDAVDAYNAGRWELIRSGKYPDPGFK